MHLPLQPDGLNWNIKTQINNSMATIDKKILVEGIKDLTAIEKFGRDLAVSSQTERNGKRLEKRPMTTSQIRRFFGAIKRIQADFDNLKGEIILLEPKLAYAVGRDTSNTKIREFYTEVSILIKDINENEEKFRNFVNVIEAIVAYHKAQGGN